MVILFPGPVDKLPFFIVVQVWVYRNVRRSEGYLAQQYAVVQGYNVIYGKYVVRELGLLTLL